MDHLLFADTILLLAISVLAIALFSRLRLPPILGYLFVGALVGPHGLAWVQDGEVWRLLGEIGVAFLLFTIGLEFSLARFRSMRDILVRLGASQVFIGTLSGAVIAWALGMSGSAAIIVGGALALSSTALVVKQLSEQLELHARHGQLALGILLFQDLAAVPFLVLIPLLSPGGAGASAGPILLAMAKALAAVALMLAAGRWILRPFFHLVSAARYPELFTLAVLLVALAAAWLTSLLGLSLALGAFVAGLMLGETEYRHQIESDIRPFRDVLLGLFFITVGMQLDPRAAQHYGGWIALLVAGVVAGKGAVIAILTHLLGYGVRNAIRTGIVLGQGGEFGLALITLATTTALIRPEHSTVIITAIVATMVLAPFLVRHNERLVEALGARDAGGVAPGAAGAHGIDAPAREHVIICGYGRTGALTGRVLSEEGIPWVAIDPDPERVREAWQRGDSVVFGNARNPEVLDGANVSGARVLVVTFDDLNTATAVVRAARAARNDIPILVRARASAGLEQLLRAGATDGVPEAFETALMLALQLLLFMEVPTHAARRRIEAVQRRQYPLLGGFFQALETGAPQGTVPASHLHSLTLPAGASAVGQRLETLGLAQRGVVPVLVRRAGERRVNAEPELVLQAGDVLIMHAEAEDFARAERWLLRGEDGG